MFRSIVFLPIFLVVLISLTCQQSPADIIGGQTSGTKELTIPETLLPELDEKVAIELKPLMTLYVNSDFVAFKSAYEKIAATTDTLPAAEVFWAKLHITGNRLGDAIKVLEEYGHNHQDDPELFTTLGFIAVRSGRFTDAWLHLLYAQRMIDKDQIPKSRLKFVLPTFVEARAIVAESRRQWPEAEQLFVKLQTLKPNDHSITWRFGRCQVLAGNIEKGHRLMVEANKGESKLPRASLAVAQILAETTNWQKDKSAASAIEEWFNRAINENEADEKAWVAYFRWLILGDRPQEVKDKGENLSDELKKVREVIVIRSVAARYLGDNDTAEGLLTPLHQEKPDDLEVADQLALVLIESSDEAKRGRALQLAERNFRAASDMEQVAATAAWIQLQLGGTDVADKILSQLATRGPLSAQTTYYIAELLQKSGKTAESQKLLKIASETPGLFPQRAKAKQSLSE